MSAPLNIPSCTADQLFEARLKAGISRSALARLARVSVRSIYDFEMVDRQKKSKGLARAIAVLTAAGCDPRVDVEPVDPAKAARAEIVEPVKAAPPKRAALLCAEPMRKPAPAKAVVKTEAIAPRPAMKPNTTSLPRAATRPVAPQPPKAKPVSVPPPAPIATWQDDRSKIAQAVLDAKQRWLARTGPRAEEALAYIAQVECGLAPWNPKRV